MKDEVTQWSVGSFFLYIAVLEEEKLQQPEGWYLTSHLWCTRAAAGCEGNETTAITNKIHNLKGKASKTRNYNVNWMNVFSPIHSY